MRHALRKLIAFVFLGGIFVFVYFDVANIFDAGFQNLIAALVAVFGVFWLVVPWLVVEMRIFRRNAKNRRGYEAWKEGEKVSVKKVFGRETIFHEKGTFYVEPGAGFDGISQPGRIGEVAFPREKRRWRKIQRVHCYLKPGLLEFLGKELELRLPLADLLHLRATPGGIVFEAAAGESPKARGRPVSPEPPRKVMFCFTFANPLIARDLIKRAAPCARQR